MLFHGGSDMPKHFTILTAVLAVFLSVSAGVCYSDSQIIDNGNGTYSMENGIFLRQYDGYSEESQQFLSVLDACYSMIASYSEIIDPYIGGEKSFEDDQWGVIENEVRYMSGFACSWVLQNEVPAELSGHGYDIFYSAYHLLIANDLLLTAFRIDDSETAALASYYYSLADSGLEWWDRS